MIECTTFKTHQKGYLQGFADFYIDKWGIELKGCTLFMKEGRRWISFPSKEYEDEQGTKKYVPYIRFRKKEHQDIFNEQAKRAIDDWCKKNSENKQEKLNVST